MNSEQLQRAVDAYLANGGVIRECVAPEPPPLDPNVVAQLKACAHVTEAARKLNMNTRTVNKLARITGHEFAGYDKASMQRLRIDDKRMLAVIRGKGGTISQNQLCKMLSITRARLRRIARENHLNINSRPGRDGANA